MTDQAPAPSAAAASTRAARLRILPGLTRRNWSQEAIAGITLAAIAVPLNIGYAQVAGLPPTAGLYSLIVPAAVFAVLASTRQLIASPDAAAAALISSALIGLAAAGSREYIALSLAQAMIAGVMFLAVGAFRLGFLANFLSEPILVGFVGGLALDILVSQIAKMLGVHVNSGDDFIPRVGELFGGIAATNVWSVAIAVGSIAILVAGRRIARRIPWALVVLILTTLVLVVAGLDKDGVRVLGHVDAGPPVLTWPELSFSRWVQLIPSAFALVLVTMAEGLLVARNYAEKRGYRVSANRDLIAFGGANILSGLTGGFTIGSSASRTAAMDQAGSRTQLPAIVAAAITLALLIFGTALLADIPSPAIGAIIAVAVVPLLGFRDFARLWRLRKFEFAVAAACFLGSLLLGPIVGIVIAFFLSLINLAERASHPPVDVLSIGDGPSASLRGMKSDAVLTAPGVAVIRFAAPVFFANAVVFTDSVHRAVELGVAQGLKHLVLDCEAITDVDVTAAKAIGEAAAWVRSRGVSFDYSRVRGELRSVLDRFDLVGEARIFETNRAAESELSG
jgi:high affinity sulfate transporter 1